MKCKVACVLFLLGCSGERGASRPNDEELWRSRGYGMIWAVDGDRVTAYQVSRVHRAPLFEGEIADEGGARVLYELDDGERSFYGTLELEGDRLISTAHDLTAIVFDRIAALPEVPYTAETEDPVASFEVFWNVIDENFPFFSLLPDLDWAAVHDMYAARIDASTTERELFDAMAEMIDLLRDGHSGIESDDDDSYGGPARPIPEWLNEPVQYNKAYTVMVSYLDGTAQRTAGGYIDFGVISGTVGYMNVRTFSGFSDGDARAESEVLAGALDEILIGFADLEALIIDYRLNDGGYDNLAADIASRLTEVERLGYSKQARIGGPDEFGPLTEVRFGPEGRQFLGRPVIVLTSAYTFSAGEVGLLPLKEIPNVTIIGEATFGVFSNTLDVELPNGWEMSTSNERYLSADGTNYEQKGVPPDIEVAYDQAALAENRDTILERALTELGVAIPPR